MINSELLSGNQPKDKVIAKIEVYLTSRGFEEIVEKDLSRPWGGFWRVPDKHATLFVQTYLPEEFFDPTLSISPKILLVAPGKKLSWQYHGRRKEVWRVLSDCVGVYKSDTDQQPETISIYSIGQVIHVGEYERHRIAGLDNWGVVAEIWSHLDPKNPSDENDIVRLQDDFDRK